MVSSYIKYFLVVQSVCAACQRISEGCKVPSSSEGLVLVHRHMVNLQKEELYTAHISNDVYDVKKTTGVGPHASSQFRGLQTSQKVQSSERNEVYGVAHTASRWRIERVAHQLELPPRQDVETYSQSGEDYDFYLNFVANRTNRKAGHFVEIGALNGVQYSNTKFLEDSLGWSGLLIEATPRSVKELQTNRPSEKNLIIGEGVCPKGQGSMDFVVGDFGAVNGDPNAMSNKFKDEWHSDSKADEIITVPCRPLGEMMKEYLQHSGADSIDFFSLDVEGGELKVLETMDWSVPVKVWCIEFDGTDPSKEHSIRELMSEKGYVVAEFAHSKRNEWFVKSDLEKSKDDSSQGIPSFDVFDMRDHPRNPGRKGDCKWRCDNNDRCARYEFDATTLICKMFEK